MRLLLANPKVDPDSKDNSRQTPPSLAAANGHEVVTQLFKECLSHNPPSTPFPLTVKVAPPYMRIRFLSNSIIFVISEIFDACSLGVDI